MGLVLVGSAAAHGCHAGLDFGPDDDSHAAEGKHNDRHLGVDTGQEACTKKLEGVEGEGHGDEQGHGPEGDVAIAVGVDVHVGLALDVRLAEVDVNLVGDRGRVGDDEGDGGHDDHLGQGVGEQGLHLLRPSGHLDDEPDIGHQADDGRQGKKEVSDNFTCFHGVGAVILPIWVLGNSCEGCVWHV